MIATERLQHVDADTVYAVFESRDEMLACFTDHELRRTLRGDVFNQGDAHRDPQDWFQIPRNVRTPDALRDFLRNGDAKVRRMVDGELDKWREVSESTEVSRWATDVAGAFPIMPAYIAGDEYCMRRKVPGSGLGPIRVVVDCGASDGTSGDAIARAAAQIAAIVLAITKVRPVELWTFNGDRKRDIKINVCRATRIEIDVADAGALAMAFHPALMRAQFRWCNLRETEPDRIDWTWGLTPGKEREERIRQTMALDPTDIVIPGRYLQPTEQDAFLQRMLKPQECET